MNLRKVEKLKLDENFFKKLKCEKNIAIFRMFSKI